MEKICRYCKRIIIEDFELWLEDNPEERYIQCPYCNKIEEIY